MAFDTHLADRVRELVGPEAGVSEKRMFGGLVFLIDGHMALAVSGQGGLMVRIDPVDTEKLLSRAHVSPMVMRGKELRGWIRVGNDGVKTKKQLQAWVDRGVTRARLAN
jgi:TfoX/Sxy family transcriptional regulator of competence genes